MGGLRAHHRARLVCDLLLVGLRRLLTPWRPGRDRRRSQPARVLTRPTPGGGRGELLQLRVGLAEASRSSGTAPRASRSGSWQQLGYTGLSLLIAALIAHPAGHADRAHRPRSGRVVNLANAWRAIPTLGLLVLLAICLGFSVLAWLVPLVVLAIPPILVNVYEGVAGVDPRPQGRGPGHGHDPLAAGAVRSRSRSRMPLIVLGLRTGAIFVVATATIAAYIGLGGLGRYIIDGLANNNYGEVAGGALFVVAPGPRRAGAFVGVRRLAVPAGLRQQGRSS